MDLVLPKLYKKTNKNAIQTWTIHTEGNVIVTRFGQQDGKIQETRDSINEGKNVGKRNATTCEEQARSEAQSRWNKKVAGGYVVNSNDASQGKVDTKIVCGGVSPMLAQDYDKHFHKIVFPVCSQPKLDGIRGIICIDFIDNK